ncbi:Fe-S cluster assembly protein SufD [Roseimaritima ulvae]|uniref:FeS cluster assembly protein SufB n=1 Tax=Roseimaritima ulvae TaxID=980254 RepID=A0A5B9QRW6_9BACT|nr:Fe-S cluster assembly protein SufD [Roseimaritima ulvae]QEG40095.1 FeS cluster assembly protein SufB [Roseimaritima ulvae]
MTQTASTAPAAFDADGFQTFLATRQEPTWLTDLRRQAWDHFEAMQWPERRSEEWIRTDLRLFQLKKHHPPTAPAADVAMIRQLTAGVDLGGQIETLDSQLQTDTLAEELAAQGVVFGSLERLAGEQPELVRKYLFSTFDPDYDKFAALHAAFFAGGQFLYVPKGVVVDRPLHIASMLSDGGTDTGHTVVVLDEGAEVTVLREANSPSREAGGLHVGAVEIIQEAQSHLRFVDLQEWGYKCNHFAHQKARVGKDASLQWTIAAMGAGFAKVNQTVELVGEGASSQVNGVMFTEGRQHVAYHTLQHHVAANCQSDFLYKAAQQDHSRTVWRGMIKVDQEAQKTNGYQRNDNLVLSQTSRADSIPGLEIEADDVRCTHGSTTAQVDEEQIFYALCRGFTRKEAVRMIVTGFFQQIFDRITIESVREALGRSIAQQVREYE